jgi:UPF0755 protein
MKRILRILFVLFLAVLISLAGVAYWIYRDLHTPVNHNKTSKFVEVPRGSAPAAVTKRLASEGIITHQWPLDLYMKFTGAGSRLKAGDYKFPSPITPLAVLQKLEQGEQRMIRLTVIEGWTRWDIANAMARIPELELKDSSAALGLMDDVTQIKDLDSEATNLEGYIYPDTYEFPPNTTPKAVIDMMVKRFLVVWTTQCAGKARLTNTTPRQIVTIASLIETEAKLSSERPIIASVIYNRLQKNIPLGVDSSIIYASKLAGKWKNDGKVYKSDVERISPYNTRIHQGLPPGPIASPSESSLKAAVVPAETNYIYYVREPSRNDGTHNFYANGSDFEKGVQALRKWEQQRDAENAARKNHTSR